LTREQRLVFGEVAEAYHDERPGYPAPLFDDVVALAEGRAALEVGAGTGKATADFAARGMDVLALEPSAEMAAVARGAVPEDVRFVLSGFEDFSTDERFDLVYAAQSWHWVDEERGFAKAGELLRPGGLLALFWNLPVLDGSDLERERDEVYRRLQPALYERGHARELDYAERIRASGRFGEVSVREYPWTERRSAESWVRLLGTFSDHRLLPDDDRDALLGEVARVIERHGGFIEVRHVARLFLARSAGPGELPAG
jgi:SAM-dependent methyltransferase